MSELHERICDISIIIPVYNLEEYLDSMLLSLLLQDYGEYTHEIIFVLNNCTDKSEDVIRKSGLDCTIINCETQGCGPARNAGLEIAKGNYVWMLDGDDWLMSDTAVRDVLSKAYETDADILWIPYASDNYKYYYFSMVWQYLIKRSFIGEQRFPNYQPAEDDAFSAELLRRAGYIPGVPMMIPHMDKPLYFYNYMREGSNMYRVYHGEKI